MHTHSSRSGFTLVEVIVTLVIIGVVAGVGTLGVAEVMRSYILTRDHSDMAQNAQVLMARLHTELQHIADVTASTATSITYSPCFNASVGNLGPFVLAYDDANNELTLDNDLLATEVMDFQLRYCSSSDTACNPTSSFVNASTEIIEVYVVLGGADTNATGNRVQRSFLMRVQPVVFHFS